MKYNTSAIASIWAISKRFRKKALLLLVLRSPFISGWVGFSNYFFLK
jgi:hypothetical protein